MEARLGWAQRGSCHTLGPGKDNLHLLKVPVDVTFTLRVVWMPLPSVTFTFSIEIGVTPPHSQEIWYAILYILYRAAPNIENRILRTSI